MTGPIHILGLRMAPHLLPALAGCSASDVRDATPTFEQLGSVPLRELLETLTEKTINKEICETVVAGVGRLLREFKSLTGYAPNFWKTRKMSDLSNTPGSISATIPPHELL